jgi:hypothetical protein
MRIAVENYREIYEKPEKEKEAMPVNSTHPAFNENRGLWQRCRDVFAGSDIVKNR